MRLEILTSGHSLPRKVLLGLIKRVAGFEVIPDVIRTLMYRHGYWGRPMNLATQAVMRGRSEWRVADRELFAAYVSRLNQCLF